MTRLLRIALATIVPLLLVAGVAAKPFAAQDRGGSSLTPAANTPAEAPAPTTDTTETSPPPEPAASEATQTTTTAPPTPPLAQAPARQQTVPAQPRGPSSMTACVTLYGQRICEPYHPPSGQYPSGNSTAPNVTQYYPSVSKDPIRNPNVVHPR